MATIEELQGELNSLSLRIEILEDLVRDSTLRRDSIEVPASFNGGVGFKAYVNLAGAPKENDEIMAEQTRLVEEKRAQLTGKPEKEVKPKAVKPKAEPETKAPKEGADPPAPATGCVICGAPIPPGQAKITKEGTVCQECFRLLPEGN